MDNRNLPDLFDTSSWGDRILSFSRMLGDLLGVGSLNPAVNLQENGDELILSVDLPGFDPRNIDVTVDGNMVIIKADSIQEETREEPDRYFAARSHRSFYREIPLAAWVRAEQTTARYKEGLLELNMKKGKTGVRGFKPFVSSNLEAL